jgi:CRP-like cAMP-binding protein
MSLLRLAGARPVALCDAALFAGIARSDVDRLEHFMARFETAAGERLFRQGDQSACMHLIERGRIDVHVETTGTRTQALAQLGPGEVLGEISLLGAGTRTATAVAVEPTSGWVLYRAGFETLRIDSGAGSVELMARIAELAVSRLRARYEKIASELGEDDVTPLAASAPRAAVPAAAALCTPDYLHSLLCFRAFHDHEQIAAAIGAAAPYELPRGSTVTAPDGASAQLLLVLRGAVDVSARRGATAQRVRLAGPGRFIGHLGVLDRGPSPVVAHARERVVLVALPGERVRKMLRDPSAVARRFSAAIAEDTAWALRQAERPIARTSAAIAAHGNPATSTGWSEAPGNATRSR